MRGKANRDRRCSYVVQVEHTRSASELRELARYLSMLSLHGCEVVILDSSPRFSFDSHARVLRWVGRHVPVRADELLRAAARFAACEKVIVATDDVRYTPDAIGQLCDLLDAHEVVEPQDYFDPLPWWGGIETGRILVHRAIEPQPDHGATFGFRRTPLRALRGWSTIVPQDDPVRRLVAIGAEVFPASGIFVRREPGALDEWLHAQPRVAGRDFALPVKTAFFLSLLPLLLLLSILGGLQIASTYTGLLAFATLGLAMRGRTGATELIPVQACLFAPLWLFERSVTVYWALLRKLLGRDVVVAREDMASTNWKSTTARHG